MTENKECDIIMENEYKVVGKFLSPSKITSEIVKMVVVRDERGACTMPEDEWKWVQERWKKNMTVA